MPIPSLGDQLLGARAKLKRADEHIESLRSALEEFKQGEPLQSGGRAYDPGVEGFIPSREEEQIVERVGQIYLPRPERRVIRYFDRIPMVVTLAEAGDFSDLYRDWGVRVGEVVHLIASALDNLVWELAQPIPAAPPSGAAKSAHQRHLNQSGFPYTRDRAIWVEHQDRYLHFVQDQDVRHEIEQRQPFYFHETTGEDPEDFSLAVVHDLWNRDKHETVNVAAVGTQFLDFKVRMPDFFPGLDRLDWELIESFPVRRLVGVTDMAKLFVRLPHEIGLPKAETYELLVMIQPSFRLVMLFGDGPGQGLNVLDTLMFARKHAGELIDGFV